MASVVNRDAVIQRLKNSANDWDVRTAEYMEQNATMSEARARAAAHRDLVHEADERWRASA